MEGGEGCVHVDREGREGKGFSVASIRECVTLSWGERGEQEASHRKHTDRANWKTRGRFEVRSARDAPFQVSVSKI